MSGAMIVDVVVVILLVAALVNGYVTGVLRSLSSIVGVLIGGTAAFFIVPYVSAIVPDAEWRTPASIASALALVFLGLMIGASVGHFLRRQADRSKLGVLDRVLGSALTFVATSLVVSLVAFSISAMGVPLLSPAIASSNSIRTIDQFTPDNVKSLLAQLRSLATEEGPRILDAFSGVPPQIPDVPTDGAAVSAAAQSVVKITGTAYACGQNQSGTGFVVSRDRIVTNAHVVAGVSAPVVESPDGAAHQGEIVYFDPVDDLAVIAVHDINAAPLQLSSNLGVGTGAVASGYPFGGPFDADPAEVMAVGMLSVADIYGQSPSPRQVYTLASDVQQGESGGPLLTSSGLVAGVIFAKASNTKNVGYALAMNEVAPVANKAASLSATVESGNCTQD